MKTEIKRQFPKWTNELTSHLFGLNINYFYDFRRIARLNQLDTRQSIGVDLALKNGYCFDNHMTKLNANTHVNSQSANINVVSGVHRDRYTDKFAMSTLIQLWSLYGLPLPKTVEGKKILLCTDVGFKGYYSDLFRPIFLCYLEQLEMMELVDILESHTKEQMYDFMIENELDSTIRMYQSGKRKGQLFFETSGSNPFFFKGLNLDWISEHLGFNVELPAGQFEVIAELEGKTIDWYELDQKTMERAFSYAFINKNKVMISLMKGETA